MKKEYVCVCGKKFDNSQAFNGHKSQCKEHQLNKYGNLDKLNKARASRNYNIRQTHLELSKNNKNIKLQKWVAEKHRCEKCGKIMTEYYGSGRFCSKSCANSRQHDKKEREAISKSIRCSEKFSTNNRIKNQRRIEESTKKYNLNPKYCVECGKIINYKNRHRITCSNKCKLKYISRKNKGKCGGYIPGSGNLFFHKGYYKGIYCDSTWELVYVVYNIDHNIPFKRCERVYEYEYNGKKHKYYPDFELDDGTIIEIKGYDNGTTEAKINSVKDRPIKVLYKDDLKYAFNYVKDNYEYKNLKDLYEK